jgi:hypothetical protein
MPGPTKAPLLQRSFFLHIIVMRFASYHCDGLHFISLRWA